MRDPLGRLRSAPLLLVALALLLTACDRGDGTTLRPPGVDGATPPPTILTTTSIDPLEGVGTGFALRSSAFPPDGSIPALYAHRPDGPDISPPLSWANVPEGTVELALVMTDPVADGFVHWVIWGIDPFQPGLFEAEVPAGAAQAVNDFGGVGYGGPQPPAGETHAYVFRLFALGEDTLDIPDGISGRSAIPLLEAKAIAIAELTGLYP